MRRATAAALLVAALLTGCGRQAPDRGPDVVSTVGAPAALVATGELVQRTLERDAAVRERDAALAQRDALAKRLASTAQVRRVASRGGVRSHATIAAPQPSGDVWWRLALCESGGRNVDTGNGYSGYFQFSDATWRGIGESGRPVQASYEVQRAAAQRLQARSGWGQWPVCSRKIGAR